MKKILLFLLLLIVLVGVGGYFYLGSFLSSVVRSGIERFGPKYTQTSVSIDSVAVSPFAGGAGLTGLTVGNPEGYQTEYAFYLGDIQVKMDPASLIQEVIVINEVIIDEPRFNFEHRSLTSNFQKILDNVNKALPPSTKPQEQPEEAQPKRFIVEYLELKNAHVYGSVAGNTFERDLPALRVEKIGVEKGGVTAAEASVEVMRSVLGQVMRAVVSDPGRTMQVLEDLKKEGGLEGGLKNLQNSLFGAGKKKEEGEEPATNEE